MPHQHCISTCFCWWKTWYEYKPKADLIKAVAFVGNPWCSKHSSSHLCDTESTAFYTSTHTQVMFSLLNCASSALSIRRLSMHPIDPCMRPFWSICIRPCVVSCSFSSSSITDVIALYNVINPLTAEWALRALIDFTLSNARRFYSSMENSLNAKGLNMWLAVGRLAAGSFFLGIIIHLPSWSFDGSESSLLIISLRAVAICRCSAVSFLIQKLVILSDQFFFFLMLL